MFILLGKYCKFKQVFEEYKESSVDFIVVYIEEAHPTDKWSIDFVAYKIKQPKMFKERLSSAKMFANDTQMECPTLVDNMNDEASFVCGALPERLYITYDGKIAFEGGIGPLWCDIVKIEIARGVASLARSGWGKAENRGGQSFDVKLLQYFKS